jgi:hypothetical protein
MTFVNRFIAPPATGCRLATVLAAGLAIGLVSTLLPAWWAAAAMLALAGALGWFATLLLARGFWVNLSQPVLASSLALFGGVSYQYFVEGREKRKMNKTYRRAPV